MIRRLAGLAGYSIETFGNRTVALIDQKRTQDGWFSFQTHMARLIAEYRIDLVVDVGANEGQFGESLRKIYRGELISFEPIAAVHAKLAQNSAGDPNWTTFKCGLGAEESDKIIHVANDSVFSSLLASNAYAHERFGHAELVTHEEVIRIRRLDKALLDAVPDIRRRRILLKIDTQGYDLEVFAGAAGVIDSVSVLQSEVSCRPIYEGMPHWTDVIAIYERAGFGVSGFFPVTRDENQVVEFDCLLTRSTRLNGADVGTSAMS